MSRIGRQPIPLPAGVKYVVNGGTLVVDGPLKRVTASFMPSVRTIPRQPFMA
jgi:ribosomal protein L6P/L9E